MMLQRVHRFRLLSTFTASCLCGLILWCPYSLATERVNDEPALGPSIRHKNPESGFLGRPINRGTLERRSWSAGQPLSGLALPTPVLVASGLLPGPTLCLTGAVHGDELNGVEIIRRIMFALDTQNMTGTVIGVPIVNLYGFQRNSRYLPDRRDLNRYFPGNPRGSSAARIAYHFFNDVISFCDALIDIHTGSFHRTNLPQLRADLSNSEVTRLSEMFEDFVVLHSVGAKGTLRRAAVSAGIPAVTLEAGEPLYLQPEEVAKGVSGVLSALRGFGLMGAPENIPSSQKVFYGSLWVRADLGGVLFSEVRLGDKVRKGQLLGSVTDPITNHSSQIVARSNGTIIGMALNQMVMPGFAAYHLGIAEEVGNGAAKRVAERAADVALEPVRKAIEEVAEKAAKTAAESGNVPSQVSKAAEDAAKSVIQKKFTPTLQEPGQAEEVTPENDSDSAVDEPDEHPE